MSGPDPDPTGGSAPTRALAGLRVLDLAILFSAPQIATMLGDLGADVVKLEPPARDGRPGGDPMRTIFSQLGARSDAPNGGWVAANRGKRSLQPGGRQQTDMPAREPSQCQQQQPADEQR